jgi:lipoprotein-releasing system permease protein
LALVRQLAFRYLRGKRSANAVPILSRISMVAIAVSSAAMIIVFSVFNGLEFLVKDLYNSFYPDIKISAARGKFFGMDAAKLAAIKQVSGVRNITTVIEDNVFADNHGQQKVITLKGIDRNYFNVNDIKQYIVQGADSVSQGRPYTAIAGQHIANELGADVNNVFSSIELFYPNPAITNPEADPLNAYQSLKLHPAGTFQMQDEFDSKYVLAPLTLAQELFHEKGRYSSVEISADPGSADKIKERLQHLLGPGWKTETRFEQNRTLYMVMGAEKWAIYAILILVLLIASFNMVGALSMLVLEKRKDIAILRTMGAESGTIRKIFLLEGALWSLTGGLAGIILGCAVCLAQQRYGFIKLSGAFLVDAWPVRLQMQDIALVMATILLVGLLASLYPSFRSTNTVDPSLKSG